MNGGKTYGLTDAERWELLHRCLRIIELRKEQIGPPPKGLAEPALTTCDVEGLRLSRLKHDRPDTIDILRLEVLMPMTVPDQSTIFQIQLPITPDALNHRLWGNWRDGPYVLDIMRKAMVLDDLATV